MANSEESVNIVVKTVNNESYNLNVGLLSSVSTLKAMVTEVTSIGSDRQRLIYRGRVLKDEDVVGDYHIEEGHTVHMVARPENYRELQQQSSAPEPARQPPALPFSLGQVLSEGGSLFSRSAPAGGATPDTPSEEDRALAIRNANQALLETNLENIRQSLLTINTIYAGSNSRRSMTSQSKTTDIRESPATNCRKFYIGQWVDVKDTVSQWLEATILDVDNARELVFVHYNGW